MTHKFVGIMAGLAAMAYAPDLWAAQPYDGQLGLQAPATPIMEDIYSFHNMLVIIIVGISLFVLALLAFIALRFNQKANPVPSKTTHNTMLEIIWTAIPVMILVVIAIPSFRLLYKMDETGDADMTIKAIGNQWYWTYVYPDHDDITFDSNMIEDDKLKPGQPRLLAVDNPIVVPVNAKVRIQTTSMDVIHGWAIPAFGAKIDSIPGQVNELWFKATKVGTYYGQCSELCGIKHAFMPIQVNVVSEQAFEEWLARAKEEFAGDRPGHLPEYAASYQEEIVQ